MILTPRGGGGNEPEMLILGIVLGFIIGILIR